MFYKQFSKITDLLGEEIAEAFDFWLATLPRIDKKGISASGTASKLGISYSLADRLLKYAEKEKILERYFMVRCPFCDDLLGTITKDDIKEVLADGMFCEECDKNVHVTTDDIYSVYRVIKKPDVSEAEIAKAIDKRLNKGTGGSGNFNYADSLSGDTSTLYEIYYSPDESAYSEFARMRKELEKDFGKDTTAKGKALENLIVRLLKEIKYVHCNTKIVAGRNQVPSGINQFDITGICGIRTLEPSIFLYLSPYFIVECKNETKKPGNSYLNKLMSIMDTNDARLGIVWGRKTATSTCGPLAREHYLKHSGTTKEQVVITMSDDDLDLIIDKRFNLLKLFEFKVLQITTNSFDSKLEDFYQD